MIPGNLYRHQYMVDVDVYVLESTVVAEGIRARVKYWSRTGQQFLWDNDEILIKTEDLPKWKTLSTEATPPKESSA